MAVTGKLLLAADLARSMYSQWRLQHLVRGMMVAAGLVIITSLLLCVILVGGFYAAYLALLHYGWEPQDAFIIIAVAFVTVTAFFVALTAIHIRRLRAIPGKWLAKTPGTHAGEAIDAFLHGLTQDD